MFRPTRLAAAAAISSLLAACVSVPSQPTLQQVRTQQNPADRAQRTITNFTPALRCMDEMMFRIGTRDVTLMMEELRDATQKVPVSARDMMTSAISDMTRRSRAVRLSVFGNDQQNLSQLLQQAQKTSAFAVLPEYNVRGTISQLDEDVKKESFGLGLLAERAFGVRLGGETKFSVLGFDSAVVRTDTMTLVAGVSSKNTTVIARRDSSAGDGQARILGAGTVFSFAAARSEGTSQAARNMVELAAIELVGKLIRAPYWQCVGTPDEHPEVQRELEDWFVAMDDDERIVFVKERMRERRYFDGALDAKFDARFAQALEAYRRALDLPPAGAVDFEFFSRFVSRPVPPGPLAPRPRTANAPAVAQAASAASAASSSTPVAAVEAPGTAASAAPPIKLSVQAGNADTQQLQLAASSAGYVYCYAQDPASKAIRRIFPNRFTHDPRVEAGASLALPGGAGFSIGAGQQLACVHAPREVYNDLPPPLRWGDFEDVRLPSFDDIRLKFAEASGQNVVLVRAAASAAP